METVRLDEGLFRTILPNGLVVLSERLPWIRSAALGVWVRSASAHEQRAKMGVSHMLEHMVFKGTERRSAHEIALALEARGGSVDAWTGRDHTSFQTHTLDADLPLAVDLLTDLVRRPLLRQEDLESERRVVIEEISSVEDAPDDLVFELHSEALWQSHPYGYPILGTRDSVSALQAEDLKAAHSAGYYPANCVVAAAGHFEHDDLLRLMEAEGWFEGGEPRPARPPLPVTPAAHGVVRREPRATAQSHIVFGTDTFATRDPRRFAIAILNTIFGGGMSSRLFQRIREQLGLAYAVYSYQHFHQSAGQMGVYVGTQPDTADAAEAAIRAEYDRIASEGLSEAELEDGKRQLKGQLMLALENPLSRMGRLAAAELLEGRYRPLDDVLAEIDAVTQDDIRAVAAEFFPSERQTVVRLGPD